MNYIYVGPEDWKADNKELLEGLLSDSRALGNLGLVDGVLGPDENGEVHFLVFGTFTDLSPWVVFLERELLGVEEKVEYDKMVSRVRLGLEPSEDTATWYRTPFVFLRYLRSALGRDINEWVDDLWTGQKYYNH